MTESPGAAWEERRHSGTAREGGPRPAGCGAASPASVFLKALTQLSGALEAPSYCFLCA